MSEQKRVSAIVRGPKGYFSKAGVLHPPGSLVSFNPEDPENTGVPVDEVSTEDFRMKEVTFLNRDGDEKTRSVRVPVKFRPVAEDSNAKAPEPSKLDADGKFNAGKFLSANVQDISGKIANGDVDDFLDVIESAENAKGSARAGVIGAVQKRREALTAG